MGDPVQRSQPELPNLEAKTPEALKALRENEKNLQPFLDGIKNLPPKDHRNFFAHSLEWDNQYQKGQNENDFTMANNAKLAMRYGGMSPEENGKDPSRKHILLAASFLERENKQPSKLAFKVDFTGNKTAEEVVGLGDMFANNIKTVKVMDDTGTVVSEEAFRAIDKTVNPHRIGYFDKKTYLEKHILKYVPVYHDWSVEILSTGSEDDFDVQRVHLGEKILFEKLKQDADTAQQSLPRENQSQMPPVVTVEGPMSKAPQAKPERARAREVVNINGKDYEKVDRRFWTSVVGENTTLISNKDPVEKNKPFTFLGKNFAVNRLIMPYLVEVEERLRKAGIKFNPEVIQSYNKRNITDAQGKDTGKKSLHSWGVALDIDPSKNPRYKKSGNMPAEVLAVFRSVGFNCGADWNPDTLDEMHLEFDKDPSKCRDLLQSEKAKEYAQAVLPSEIKAEKRDEREVAQTGLESASERALRKAEKYMPLIEQACRTYPNVDKDFVVAVMNQESGFNPNIASPVGAGGLMQIMPDTYRGLGNANAKILPSIEKISSKGRKYYALDPEDDRANPEKSIMTGVKLLSKLLNKYNGDMSLTLAGYNAGEGAVAKYGNRVPPYRETQNYVARIMSMYQHFKSR